MLACPLYVAFVPLGINGVVADFVECLEATLAAVTPEEAAAVARPEVRGLRLFFAALWASIKKLFRKG